MLLVFITSFWQVSGPANAKHQQELETVSEEQKVPVPQLGCSDGTVPPSALSLLGASPGPCVLMTLPAVGSRHWTQPYSILCLGMSGFETSPCQHLVVCKSNSVLQELIGRKALLCSPWGRWRIQPLSASRPRGPQKGICGGIALPTTWHLLGIGKRSWQQGEHFFLIMVVRLPGQLEESGALVGVWSWSKWWGEVSIAFCRCVVLLQALLAQYCK